MTYNSDYSIRLQQGVQVLQELQGEQIDGLGTTCEDIMHDVIVSDVCMVGLMFSVRDSVLNHSCVVGWQLEVF